MQSKFKTFINNSVNIEKKKSNHVCGTTDYMQQSHDQIGNIRIERLNKNLHVELQIKHNEWRNSLSLILIIPWVVQKP